MIKKFTLIALSLFIASLLYSQSIPRQVLSSAGTNSTGGNLQLSWTMGQPTPVENINPANFYITPGFQQGDEGYVNVPKPEIIDNSISCYPNPATEVVNLQGTLPSDGACTYSLLDNSGKLLSVGKFQLEPGNRLNAQIQVEHLSAGVYYIHLQGGEQKPYRALKKITVLK
ncbi:MAG: T9SS type A sorting domain-containing protein [Bacteroidales bacterium]